MSLVGSLEDLGLGDILQIVSLARKSGRLLLRTDGEAGWIVLCDGQVRGAAIKGHSDDIRSLLVGSGEISGDDFDQARERATDEEMAVDEALVAQGALSAERIDALRREGVERSVMNMFLWRTGEFSFEVRDEVDSRDEELMLATGINTQYLAMEATRLRDEGELLGPVPGESDDDDEPMFSGEEPAASPDAEPDPVEEEPAPVAEEPTPDAVDAMALASARGVADTDEDPDSPTPDGEDTLSEMATADVDAAPAPETAAPAAYDPEQTLSEETPPVDVAVAVEEVAVAAAEPIAVSVADALPAELPPVVALDTDLVGLEWLKAQACEHFTRVHIFQRDELAMDRVRRYLTRGIVPMVVASPAMLEGEDAGRSLRVRLRSLSPALCVLALVPDRGAETAEGVNGTVVRPAGLASDPETWEVHADRAAEAVEALLQATRQGPAARLGAGRPDSALETLRSVSDRLRDPDRRDDVLSVVLEFAANTLSRVAVFMLRDDEAMGMAEHGMARADGPEGDAIRAVVMDREELPALFQQALAMRRGVRGPLSPSEDADLLTRLGGRPPYEAYAAPIESGGSPVALIYGDNLPHDAPIGDTTALEIVLHEAGLALDRASLEMALASAQGDS